MAQCSEALEALRDALYKYSTTTTTTLNGQCAEVPLRGYSLTHWLTHSPTHSLTHSLTHWKMAIKIERDSVFYLLYFRSVLWHCWLGDRKGIRPVKSWVLVCWWWFDWSFVRPIAPVVTTTSDILSFNKIQNGDILILANQGHLENGC